MSINNNKSSSYINNIHFGIYILIYFGLSSPSNHYEFAKGFSTHENTYWWWLLVVYLHQYLKFSCSLDDFLRQLICPWCLIIYLFFKVHPKYQVLYCLFLWLLCKLLLFMIWVGKFEMLPWVFDLLKLLGQHAYMQI